MAMRQSDQSALHRALMKMEPALLYMRANDELDHLRQNEEVFGQWPEGYSPSTVAMQTGFDEIVLRIFRDGQGYISTKRYSNGEYVISKFGMWVRDAQTRCSHPKEFAVKGGKMWCTTCGRHREPVPADEPILKTAAVV